MCDQVCFMVMEQLTRTSVFPVKKELDLPSKEVSGIGVEVQKG